MRLINTDLISSPFNWLSVFLMALFGAALLAVLFPADEA